MVLKITNQKIKDKVDCCGNGCYFWSIKCFYLFNLTRYCGGSGSSSGGGGWNIRITTYLQDCEPPKTFFPNQTCQDVSDEDACSPECVVDADCGQPDILCCVNNICVGCPIQQDELGCCCLCNEQSYTTTFEQCQLMGGEWLEGKKCGDVITVPDSDKWACCIECNTPCQGEFGQSFHCVEVFERSMVGEDR